MPAVQIYDLAIAWDWEYDRGFIDCIRKEASGNGVSVLEISAGNIHAVINSLKKGEIRLRYLLDRASDENELFRSLAEYADGLSDSSGEDRVEYLNKPGLQSRAADKATMHLEFLAHGIDVPYTIIISPYCENNEITLSIAELAKLGRPFIIKPANTTGGGIGVVMGAETLKEVIEARQAHANDKYLLQETIKPAAIEGRRAWFRVFYSFGTIIPCWWDDATHIYSVINDEEEMQLGIGKLRAITKTIYEICRLEFFSTELVFVPDGRCIAVDYVNEICDMRLQSDAFDGVPDSVVKKVASCLIEHVISNL